MPLLQIHRKPEPARLIRMGQAAKVIEPEEAEDFFVGKEIREAFAAIAPPPEPVKNQRGRPKKMADKKITDETGVKKISQDDAGTQGAIGSGGVNAPAQEKVPEKSPQQTEQGKEE